VSSDKPEAVLDGEKLWESECSAVNSNSGPRGLQSCSGSQDGSVDGRVPWLSMAVVSELKETYVGPEIVTVALGKSREKC
jgi:hypothetical protein